MGARRAWAAARRGCVRVDVAPRRRFVAHRGEEQIGAPVPDLTVEVPLKVVDLLALGGQSRRHLPQLGRLSGRELALDLVELGRKGDALLVETGAQHLVAAVRDQLADVLVRYRRLPRDSGRVDRARGGRREQARLEAHAARTDAHARVDGGQQNQRAGPGGGQSPPGRQGSEDLAQALEEAGAHLDPDAGERADLPPAQLAAQALKGRQLVTARGAPAGMGLELCPLGRRRLVVEDAHEQLLAPASV